MDQTKSKKWFWIILLVLLVALYLGGSYYFSKYTFPNTTVNGMERSFRPLKDVFQSSEYSDKVQVQGRNGTAVSISAEDIHLKLTNKGVQAPSQNAFLWPKEVFQSHPYTVEYDIGYDQVKLDRALNNAGLVPNGKAPVDAKIEVSKDGVRIVPEDRGNKLDYEGLKTRILDAFQKGLKETDIKDLYEEPEITADSPSLKEEFQRLDKITRVKVVYDFVDRKFTFGPEEVVQCLKKEKDKQVSIDPDAVLSWVKDMARKTDTYGTDRTFKTTNRGTVTVPPGIYGWQIDTKKTRDKLMTLLKEGGNHELEPEYRHRALHREKDEIGSTYIECDLSQQHLWAYKDGKLFLQTDYVSGTTNGVHETPVGVHKIWSREKDRELKGKNLDGSKYVTPVTFWMPINYGGVGLHDAPWRSSFGGRLYRSYGTHGCLNLPPKVAEKIFNAYPVGTPVIIYESTTSFSPADSTY
ncbi:L,D-transpeptidase family protein [Kallipyga gabonensis]|uniref:L,D-transpeptidase family protein n=1 Tax=Kallipyga gabonensis TaxID=1686287 RepID=UPI0006B419AC|nr:L,D-transpeptidase family protein [Kallipyga gabonensis]